LRSDVEGAEFWHLDEHDQGGGFTDVWDAGEDLEAVFKGVAGCKYGVRRCRSR
jgi:hypothetical protein